MWQGLSVNIDDFTMSVLMLITKSLKSWACQLIKNVIAFAKAELKYQTTLIYGIFLHER